jgi:D-alanine-D-alanine ligase
MSNEAEVSVMSARNIVANLDRTKYEPVEIFWRKDGSFDHPIETWSKEIDVAFPITHGKFGEDGVLQGMLEALRIPYCGCRVLSSALCMDKAMFKKLMAGAGIPQTKFMAWDDETQTLPDFPLPWFVKPANSGSSVGITRVDSSEQLGDAIKTARQHDTKALIEQAVQNAMEVEVAVLGNTELTISAPGQIIPSREFYDYEDKYIANAARVVIPAPLQPAIAERVRSLAEQAYRLADCRGFARVDFFVQGDKVLVSEINTLPGFTDISMYPKLMAAAGISYKELLSRIIELA